MSEIKSSELDEQPLKEDTIENMFLSKDLDYGEEFDFTVQQTNTKVIIKSFKGKTATSESEKKKHYFIYSTQPGYGKRTFVNVMLEHLNASAVNSPNNFTGVREKAQFLIFVDGFSRTSQLSYSDLCLLTEGDASAFRGHKNTFIESSYVPRPDTQVIIMSNRHLFECIGKSNRYTENRTAVDYFTAKKMLERFNIIKLDDETKPEFVDAVLHINVRDNGALCHPFDVRFDRNGDPIDKDGNLTPYSLVSKFDTRNNKSFNSMKKAILIQLGKNKNLNDYFTQEACDHTDLKSIRILNIRYSTCVLTICSSDTLICMDV